MTDSNTPVPVFDKIEDIGYQRLFVDVQLPFAKKDFKVAQEFLAQYYANLETLKSYRREVERLLQWSWLIAEKSILKITREDIEAYIEFCLDPPTSWIGLKRAVRFVVKNGQRVPNDAWRPFIAHVSKTDHKLGHEPNQEKYTLSAKAIQAVFAVLGSLYNHFVDEGLCRRNPIRQIKQKKSKYFIIRQGKRDVRRLSDDQWQTVLATATNMADNDKKKHERTLFIISAMYHMYLRISELVATERWQPQMNNFYRDSKNRWWFKTVGKGNKERIISLSDDMLAALVRYRESKQLTPLPSPTDSAPLIVDMLGQKAIKSTVQVRRIVQECFDKSIDALMGLKMADEANSLQAATVHWLRHTGISDAINKYDVPIAHVRDDAGHSSAVITDIYNDADLQARYESAKKKTKIKRATSR